MVNLNIEVEGLDILDDLIDMQQIQRAVGKACALVERTAKQKAPKDTGALRRSITSEVEREGNEMVGTVFTPLEYAPYIMCGA